MISTEEYNLLLECIKLLQPYEKELQGHYSDFTTTVFTLNSEDFIKWKNLYYPGLVQNDLLMDDRFFCGDGMQKELGIGIDGKMNIYEYCNFMYQLYKTAILYSLDTLIDKKNILNCVRMLEPYAYYFYNNTADQTIYILSDPHMSQWKNTYYPNLVGKESEGKIPDTEFFDPGQKNPNYGIGKDGHFGGAELLHFLYKCYWRLGKDAGLWE